MSEIIEQGQEWGFVSMAKRLGRLEEQVCQSAKALQWIMDTLKCQGYQSKHDAPLMASVITSTDTDPEESADQEAEREKTHHFYARQFCYPGSTLKRFPVPEEKVPWEVDFSVYAPPIYNQENMQESDILTLDTYRNPKGRTGLKGKGALKSLGPNKIIDPVITRNKGSLLEFLAVWDKTAGHWTFPGGPVQPGELLPKRLETALGKNITQKIKAKIKSGNHTEVYKGYVDDVRNTDNAWVESTVIAVHFYDEWHVMTQHGDGSGESLSSTESLQWREVSGNTPVYPYQREALHAIAQKHNVKF